MEQVIKDYCKTAREYAAQVVSGEIVACKFVINACQRQIDDLTRDDFGYTFDEAKANRVCAFVELLPHIKGEWARAKRLLEIEPWQIFILTTIFGWVDSLGYRRFKTVYTEIPRKNAKSTLSSGVALYLLAADGEEGAEIYSAATTRDQARIVWQDAKRMAERTAGLSKHFGVETAAHSVHVTKTASWFKALSRDQGGNLDGLNTHGCIIDELHAHKTREIFDVIETSTGARRQPLLWLITTAGFNRAGICYEQRAYTIKFLNGVSVDEEYFGIIYTIDDDDDWTDPEVWQKANPNWGVSVNPEDIRRKARKAVEMVAAQNNFLTKHLNMWVNADTAWMDMRAWARCGQTELMLEDFTGCECFVACDLASKKDIASVAILFQKSNLYYLFVKNYLNSDAIENSTNSQYMGWARENWLIETDGNITDYEVIEDDLKELAKNYDVKEIAFDPFQASYIGQRLAKEGIPIVDYGATVANFSQPMKELEALIIQDRLRHECSPVMEWMISNTVAHMDKKDNIFPNKEFHNNKIDGTVAAIMAMGRLMAEQTEEQSPYESRGMREL